MRRARILATLGIIPVLLLVAACGGKGGGKSSPTAADPNVPVVANLRVTFGARCTLPGNIPGTLEILAFDYADADGNVTGGSVENVTTAAIGGTAAFTEAIPSPPGVTVTGTTSGTVTLRFCTHFGSNASITEHVKIADASGKVSNSLTLEVPRPGGAPLLPQDADPSLRKAL